MIRSAAPVSDDFISAVSGLISHRTGLTFSGVRGDDLRTALRRAARDTDALRPDAWLGALERDAARLDALIAEITVGETYFFREPKQYAVVQDEILPALWRQRAPSQALRCWSAGCSSGEEPYTIAILLRRLGMHAGACIMGTDLSRVALARARQAIYSSWSLRGVAPEVIAEHFHPVRRRFALHPVIRDAVTFGYLNLAEDSYPSIASGISGMDLVFCRNVLIYFDGDTIRRVATRLLDALAPGGWLILGSSDPMLGDLVPCEVVMTDAGMMYRRAGQTTPRMRWHRPNHRTVVPPPVTEIPASPPLPPLPPLSPPREAAPVVAPLTLAEAARHYAERNYHGAADAASLLARAVGGPAEAWTLWIRALANQGKLREASGACTAALEQHPAVAELHYLDAMLLGEAGVPAAAIAAARRALYLDRSLVMGHLALAMALTRQGEATAARQALHAGRRLLMTMAATDIVPASDGESAGRLLALAQAQGDLLRAGAR